MSLSFDPHEFPRSFVEFMLEVQKGRDALPLVNNVDETLDAAQVQQDAQMLSKPLFDDWQLLHEIIIRHESTIRKRWLKKTTTQKKAILLKAWPEMHQYHRPDLGVFLKTRGRETTSSALEAYKWPYINLEDLLKPRTLLLFLNSRGRNFPATFRHADYNATSMGWQVKAIEVSSLPEFTMEFTNKNSYETYGELIRRRPDEFSEGAAGEPLGRSAISRSGDGLILLEVQNRVWRFLVSCAKGILHEIPEDTLMDFEIQPEPPSISACDTQINNALLTLAMEAPYRAPANLDLRRMKIVILAKRSAAADHIWQLREDPGYFNEIAMEFKEHRWEILLDNRGQKHPFLRPGAEVTFWNRVLGNTVMTAYLWLLIWDKLHQHITDLMALEARYHTTISPDKELPQDYFIALQKFQLTLEQVLTYPIECLEVGIPPSPPMRMFWVREAYSGSGSRPEFIYKGPSVKDKVRDRVIRILCILRDRDYEIFADLKTWMDELERLTQNEPGAKDIQSAWVAAMISDLSVMSECLNQLRLYHPWSRSIKEAIEVRRDEMRAEFREETGDWGKLVAVKWEGSTLAKLGMPTEGRFTYPIYKRQNRENTEAMVRAEQNLDTFWEAVDSFYNSKCGKSLHDVAKHLLEGRVLQRTAGWVEPTKAKKSQQEILCAVDSSHEPFSQSAHDLEYQRGRNLTQALPSRSKAKTRGTTEASGIAEIVEAPAPGEQPDQLPTFKVDKRAKKVFSTIFFMPSQSDFSGEIAWADFLHAMQSTGFVPQKMYGSVWQFSPVDLDVERSIQFHQPHPSGKIPFQIARRHGRRLNRAYGWHGGIFELQQTKTAPAQPESK